MRKPTHLVSRGVLAIALAAGAVADPACAQSQSMVIPKGFAKLEGPGASRAPFGLDTEGRVMCIYNKEELPIQGPYTLSSVLLRADNDGKALQKKGIIITSLSISTSHARAESASAVFDENHGSDRTEVMPYSHLTFPAQSAGKKGPRAFDIKMPLRQPFFFSYQLSPVRGRKTPESLVLDFRVKQQPKGYYRLDSPFGCKSTHVSYGKLDSTCANKNGKQLKLVEPRAIRAGGVASYLVMNANPSGKIFLILGVGMPGPNNTPLKITSNGCYLNTIALLTMTGKANDRGIGGFQVSVPLSPQVVGKKFQAQAGAEDKRNNSLFLITSLGLRSDVCGPRGVARVFHNTSANSAKGAVSYGSAFIFEMR